MIVIFAGALMYSIYQNRRVFAGISRQTWLKLAAIVLLGIAVRYFFSPFTPQVYHDEFYYLSTAEHIARDGVATPLLNRGFPPHSTSFDNFYPPYPQGWPCLAALAMKLTGQYSYRAASDLSFYLSSLIPFFIFWAAYFLLWEASANDEQRKISAQNCGLYAALMWAVLPVIIKLTGTAAPEIASAFAVAVFLAAAFFYYRHPTPATNLLMFTAGAIAVSMRPENILYLIPAFGFIFKRFGRILKDSKYVGALILTVFILLSVIIMIYGNADPERMHIFRLEHRPGTDTTLHNFGVNLLNNLLFLFGYGWKHPLVITLFFISGLYLLIKAGHCPIRGYYLLGWWLLFYIVFSIFPFGDFANVFSYDAYRFSIHICFPVIFAASYGCFGLWAKVRNTQFQKAAAALIVIAVIATPPQYLRFFREGPELTYHYSVLQKLDKRVPEKGIMVADNFETALLIRYAADRSAYVVAERKDAALFKPGGHDFYYYTTENPTDLMLEYFNLEPYSRHRKGKVGFTIYYIQKVK